MHAPVDVCRSIGEAYVMKPSWLIATLAVLLIGALRVPQAEGG